MEHDKHAKLALLTTLKNAYESACMKDDEQSGGARIASPLEMMRAVANERARGDLSDHAFYIRASHGFDAVADVGVGLGLEPDSESFAGATAGGQVSGRRDMCSMVVLRGVPSTDDHSQPPKLALCGLSGYSYDLGFDVKGSVGMKVEAGLPNISGVSEKVERLSEAATKVKTFFTGRLTIKTGKEKKAENAEKAEETDESTSDVFGLALAAYAEVGLGAARKGMSLSEQDSTQFYEKVDDPKLKSDFDELIGTEEDKDVIKANAFQFLYNDCGITVKRSRLPTVTLGWKKRSTIIWNYRTVDLLMALQAAKADPKHQSRQEQIEGFITQLNDMRFSGCSRSLRDSLEEGIKTLENHGVVLARPRLKRNRSPEAYAKRVKRALEEELKRARGADGKTTDRDAKIQSFEGAITALSSSVEKQPKELESRIPSTEMGALFQCTDYSATALAQMLGKLTAGDGNHYEHNTEASAALKGSGKRRQYRVQLLNSCIDSKYIATTQDTEVTYVSLSADMTATRGAALLLYTVDNAATQAGSVADTSQGISTGAVTNANKKWFTVRAPKAFLAWANKAKDTAAAVHSKTSETIQKANDYLHCGWISYRSYSLAWSPGPEPSSATVMRELCGFSYGTTVMFEALRQFFTPPDTNASSIDEERLKRLNERLKRLTDIIEDQHNTPMWKRPAKGRWIAQVASRIHVTEDQLCQFLASDELKQFVDATVKETSLVEAFFLEATFLAGSGLAHPELTGTPLRPKQRGWDVMDAGAGAGSGKRVGGELQSIRLRCRLEDMQDHAYTRLKLGFNVGAASVGGKVTEHFGGDMACIIDLVRWTVPEPVSSSSSSPDSSTQTAESQPRQRVLVPPPMLFI